MCLSKLGPYGHPEVVKSYQKKQAWEITKSIRLMKWCNTVTWTPWKGGPLSLWWLQLLLIYHFTTWYVYQGTNRWNSRLTVSGLQFSLVTIIDINYLNVYLSLCLVTIWTRSHPSSLQSPQACTSLLQLSLTPRINSTLTLACLLQLCFQQTGSIVPQLSPSQSVFAVPSAFCCLQSGSLSSLNLTIDSLILCSYSVI